MTPEEKKARAYWMKRFLENAGQTHEAVDKATETLREAWAATIRDMENDINGWYSRFATEQGLTMAEARRQMTVKELAGLKLSLREFEKLAKENANGKWEQELSAALARVRISRLEAMQLSLRNYLWEAYQDTHNAASEALRDAYTSEYYHNTYETQRAEGKFSPVEEIPTAQIDAILSKPWASDGREWSSRIWDNREKLTNELQGELLRSIVQGKGPVEAAARLASKMGAGQYQAVRLIQTEATAVATMADRDSFQSLGVEKVEYVATLEAHTCPTCGGLDGKIFTLKEVAAGMTAPPMHPNCRCTLVPYFEDEKGRRWMKDPETLERKTVKDTTFEEWKKQYIKPPKKEEPKPPKPVEPPKREEQPKTTEPPKPADTQQSENESPDSKQDLDDAKEGINQLEHLGTISPDICKLIEPSFRGTDVVLPENRVLHIKERHPGDFEKYKSYMQEMLEKPDYIIKGNKPSTGVFLKHFVESEGDLYFKLVLRVQGENDPPDFYNSVITFLKANKKECDRLIKNKEILYKKE